MSRCGPIVALLFAGLLAWLAGAPAYAQAQERRVALIVGNDDYKHIVKLNNAANDARAIDARLKAMGWETIVRLNVGRRDLNRAILDFGDRIATGAIGMFFYSGHGIQVQSRNFLVPVDAEIEDEGDLTSEGIDVGSVLFAMEEARNPMNLIILDACRDNPLPRRQASGARGLAAMSAPLGTYVAYSAAPGQKAEDGPKGGNGVFTGELLKAMAEPGLKLEDVLKQATASVRERTGGRQEPWTESRLTGDFYFGGKAAAAAPAAGAIGAVPPGSTDRETVFWQSIQGATNALELEAYLQQFPNGVYSPLARARLDQIRRAQGAGVPVTPPPTVALAQRPAVPQPVAAAPVQSPVPVPGPAPPPALPQQQALVTPAPPPVAAPVPPAPAPLPAGQTFRDCPDCPEMVVIPAGSFTMGSPASEEGRFDNEGPTRRFTLRSFAAGKYEVTRGEFAAFARATNFRPTGGCTVLTNQRWTIDTGKNWQNPGFTQTDRDPVVCVNWDDAQRYVAWLRERTAKPYRLLGEAEWEYAARAGSAAARPWGPSAADACTYANVADAALRRIGAPSWTYHECNDGAATTAPVGSLKPNAFGLYDMIGNANEWVEDCWAANPSALPADGRALVSEGCIIRVLRGGSWYNLPRAARAALRERSVANDRYAFYGFRVGRTN
jgi:formylglycine-generating enzyme required for sulfatase activity